MLQIPIVKPVKGNKWELVEEYAVTLSDGSLLVIPAGFITDGASIPRIFWGIFPSTDWYFIAAIVHDFLYYSKIKTRKQSDKEFELLMKQIGIHPIVRAIFYRSVRIFGGLSW